MSYINNQCHVSTSKQLDDAIDGVT